MTNVFTEKELESLCGKMNDDTRNTVKIYLNDLDDVQIKAIQIAKSHLGTSFDILKSNGFKDWNDKRNKK